MRHLEPSPLFVTGVARSGTTLLARMLTANPRVMIASDPYFPLFRSYRNAVLTRHAQSDLCGRFNPNSPFQDYFFSESRIRTMDVIQDSDLSLDFNLDEWPSFHEKVMARIRMECPDLVPFVHELRRKDYKGMLDAAIRIVAKARKKADSCKWVGMKEVWIIELLTPLARAYPEAKFIVIMRDPRAIISSMIRLGRSDPTQLGHLLSYLRHWRKYAAFVQHYSQMKLFENRLLTVTYEKLVQDPAQAANGICRFLDIDYDQNMLNTNDYLDYATGKTWKGNSSYDEVVPEISADLAKRWRDSLGSGTVQFIDFICGPDMRLFNYHESTDFESKWPDPKMLQQFIDMNKGDYSWRSDFEDVQQDYGCELFRRALLEIPRPPDDVSLIRRSFLFEAAYSAIRERGKSASHRSSDV